MPIKMKTEFELPGVIEFIYEEPLTIEEMRQSQDDTLAIYEAADTPLWSLIDMSGVSNAPRTALVYYPQLGDHPAPHHPNNAGVVVVVRNRLVERFASIFRNVFVYFRIASTREEALAVLREMISKESSS